MVGQVAGLSPVAVCAASEATGARVKADAPGVAFYTDYTAMLDSGDIDAVLVETPPALHAECSTAALERGIHVLSDVPAVHELDEVAALWKAATANKAVFMFGATTNYWAFVDMCADLKEKGLLGDPYYLEAEYVHDITEFAKQTPWRQGYEPIRYCTHSLGPLLRWLGEEFVSVSCFDTGSHVHGDERDHDAMVAILRTKSNAVVKLMLSFVNCLPYGCHRYVYYGTKGYFECTWPLTGTEPEAYFSTKSLYGLDKMTKLPASPSRPELASLESVSGHGEADYAMLTDFVKAIAGKPCALDLRAGLKMTLPGLYALESSRRGGEVLEIRYPWA